MIRAQRNSEFGVVIAHHGPATSETNKNFFLKKNLENTQPLELKFLEIQTQIMAYG